MNKKIRKISIIVPCYNEEEGIQNLIRLLSPVVTKLKKKYKVELLFIDDGSQDKTYEILSKNYKNRKDVKIIRHKKNMNLGAALKTGFRNCTGDIIANIDSDCTYPPKVILEMLDLMDSKTDIVTASPYHPKGKVENIPGYRLFLSRSISKIYDIILNKKIYTYTALVRLYKRHVIESIKVRSDNFLGVTEMLIFSLLKGYKIKEYPTTLHVRKFGSSKIKLVGVIKSHIKFILELLKIKIFGGKI